MAAQKLTKGRLVQIIVMLVVLIAAFTWRTVTYDHSETINCIISKPCQMTIDKHNVLISDNNLGYLIETSKTGKFIISYDGKGILEKNEASNWVLKTTDKASSITITFPQQTETYLVNISKE
ncbi:hypothetical protein [Vibrio lentus]|uniref:Uncharacterized protein n=1 Tax=Vibrio lentus TaxID=136468 RepID=A0A2N7C7I5_9VIBR|nr:hypothetical protein [Vibrio lentus]PME50989.1 hypothetical protein BCV34_10605 [Vibrio lentus]PME75535.1 hypothetical protein BCV30_00255 [Vibrio lentus]PME85070.1 hypothetical protein BCV27_10390 [Vibrio lentus]PMG65871.1 hypothetical protein BCU86_14530 [Vibrio lentus]PMI56832.1 hypothetical protein BCU43_01560 [Vibrio lentus]